MIHLTHLRSAWSRAASAPAGEQHEPPPGCAGRFFVGRRHRGLAETWLVGDDVRRLDVDGPTDWAAGGRNGSVPLAAAMLREATGMPAREAVAVRFASAVVDTLPASGFVLPESDVHLWLAFAAGGGDAA